MAAYETAAFIALINTVDDTLGEPIGEAHSFELMDGHWYMDGKLLCSDRAVAALAKAGYLTRNKELDPRPAEASKAEVVCAGIIPLGK